MPIAGKDKSLLLTPDPYHTPGYGGFCPQFKYKIGETFGRTTSRLLSDAKVANSGRPVLADLEPGPNINESINNRTHILRSRKQSWGDQKLVDNMVPGYSGYIPKSEHYFGDRYSEICRNSISDFDYNYRCHDAKMQDLRYVPSLPSGRTLLTPRNNPPDYAPILTQHLKCLDKVREEPLHYISPFAKPALGSPYYMHNSDPNKLFISGYDGFVPRSRDLLGVGYPIITNKALNTFTDGISKHQEIRKLPILVQREERPAPSTLEIYPERAGMIPQYTGHIPGQKFRFGETFGNSTENAKSYQGSVSAR